ncbi:hypothetical protein [Luxibacter massiliensis]|uniref:hypothetical protein n=1 Tax=Luxibacter massiliensis TaxID=2219695 RepID=UPI000F06EBEE|nr:hypothetical protein [Luxibacter massiliensis]
MEQKYWEQFMVTGTIKDYLSYKMGKYGDGEMHSKENDIGVGYCESDSDDRDGSVYNPYWGI